MGVNRALEERKPQTDDSALDANSSTLSGGNKGALIVPLLSFQYHRRPERAARLLCFHAVGGFESHPLRQRFSSILRVINLLGAVLMSLQSV